MACLRVCTSRILVQVTIVLLLVTVLCRAEAETKKKQKNKEKIGKDITDYTDADVHRLLDQWDVSSLLIFVVWSAALENFCPCCYIFAQVRNSEYGTLHRDLRCAQQQCEACQCALESCTRLTYRKLVTRPVTT